MTGCGTERYADWFFDLDGTLVDSAPDILRLLGGVLREEGLAVPELDKGRIGPLLEDIIRGSAGSVPCGSGAHRPHLPGALPRLPL